jgi:hypothetical protein
MRATWALCLLCLLSLSLLGACGGDTGLDVTPLRAGSGSGSGTGSATGCTALAQCCATSLSGNAQVGCDQVLRSGEVATCNEALTELVDAGYCTGSGSGGSECALLSECCSRLPPESVAGCESTVRFGVEAICGNQYAGAEFGRYVHGGAPQFGRLCGAPCVLRDAAVRGPGRV